MDLCNSIYIFFYFSMSFGAKFISSNQYIVVFLYYSFTTSLQLLLYDNKKEVFSKMKIELSDFNIITKKNESSLENFILKANNKFYFIFLV